MEARIGFGFNSHKFEILGLVPLDLCIQLQWLPDWNMEIALSFSDATTARQILKHSKRGEIQEVASLWPNSTLWEQSSNYGNNWPIREGNQVSHQWPQNVTTAAWWSGFYYCDGVTNPEAVSPISGKLIIVTGNTGYNSHSKSPSWARLVKDYFHAEVKFEKCLCL